jgi:hypothetical protein
MSGDYEAILELAATAARTKWRMPGWLRRILRHMSSLYMWARNVNRSWSA